jgi:Cys-rich protein (TIGR01571 family)
MLFSSTTVALAQIMARLGFDFIGRPGQNVPRKGFWSTWGMMLTIIVFWVFLNTVVLLGFNYKWATHVALSAADAAALLVVNISMLAYVMYATAATRGSLREKYLIREHRFIDLEDCLCGTFCMPCTICQMGRHTASFGDHEGVCCNATGIPDSAPETV